MADQEHIPMDPATRRSLYRRLVLRGVLLVLGCACLVFVLPGILPMVTPFVIAMIAAMMLNPLVEWAARRLHIRRRLSAFLLTFIVVGTLFFLLGWLIYIIVSEIVSLAANINSVWSYATSGLNYLDDRLQWLVELLPGSEGAIDTLLDTVYSWLQTFSASIMDSVFSMAANVTTWVGNIVVVVTMSLLAVYFTIADYPKLSAFARGHVDRHIYGFFRKIKQAVQSAFGGYLKSQLMLALLAFVVMFAALAIYGQPYSLLIAIGLGVVDFLPIVGTIAVLLPWAVIEFFAGNPHKAIFLAILAAGFFLVRRVVEPKIMGSQTGLHPLVALLSIYAGMKISGVWGAILGPVVVMFAVNIYKSGVFDATVADLKDLYHICRTTLKRKDM